MELSRTLRDRRQRLLWKLANAGHEGSFRRLYGELYDPVHRYVSARLRDGDEAEDVVSKVFHRFLETLDRYDPSRGSVWVWTMTLARNGLIDHVRARRVHEPIEELAEVLAAVGDDPLTRLLRDEENRLLHGLLRDEPEDLREMFALRFGDGLSHREIAGILGCSEAAVKQRFSRAMRRLRHERESRTRGDEHERLGLETGGRVEDSA